MKFKGGGEEIDFFLGGEQFRIPSPFKLAPSLVDLPVIYGVKFGRGEPGKTGKRDARFRGGWAHVGKKEGRAALDEDRRGLKLFPGRDFVTLPPPLQKKKSRLRKATLENLSPPIISSLNKGKHKKDN